MESNAESIFIVILRKPELHTLQHCDNFQISLCCFSIHFLLHSFLLKINFSVQPVYFSLKHTGKNPKTSPGIKAGGFFQLCFSAMLFPWCDLSYFTFPGSFSLCPWRALLDSVESQNLRVWSHWAPSLTTESHKNHFMDSKFTGSALSMVFPQQWFFYIYIYAFILKSKTPQILPLLWLTTEFVGKGMQSELSVRFWGCNHRSPDRFLEVKFCIMSAQHYCSTRNPLAFLWKLIRVCAGNESDRIVWLRVCVDYSTEIILMASLSVAKSNYWLVNF